MIDKNDKDTLNTHPNLERNMKSVGTWVVIKKDKTTSASGIISIGDNIGVVHHCSVDKTLIGKKVVFNAEDMHFTYEEYTFVDYSRVYGVVE